MKIVDKKLLENVVSMKPATPPTKSGSGMKFRQGSFDVSQWVTTHEIPILRESAWNGKGHKWVLEECPWNGHTDNSAYIVQLATGEIGAGCHHNSCQDYGWRALREHYEPGCYDNRGTDNGAYDYRVGDYESAIVIPQFPSHVLPPTLRKYVEEASASIGCPQDFIGVPMLSTLGAAIGNSCVLEVKGGWIEGATLYTVIVGDPGAAKSPALDAATFPASKKQEELGHQFREARSQSRSDTGIMEQPVYKRCIVQDTTVEALTERLGENPRGVLSSNDELSGWIRQMDQYKGGDKGTDRQFWLSAWSNKMVVVDRKNRDEPLMVYRPFVAVAGGIQPGILSELKNNREDGLLDRFLFGYPDSMPTRWSDIEISEESRASYKKIFDELYGLEMDNGENGSPAPIRVTFTASAKKLFIQEYNSLHTEMEHPDFPAHLKGPWKKMVSYLARLSLIICMAHIVESGARYGEALYEIAKHNPTIIDKHVRAAVALTEYFKAHTRKVYAKLPGSGKSSDKQGKADKGNSAAHFLKQFLKERGGYWKGMTSELYEICTKTGISDLPGGAGAFGKKIREIAQDPDNGFVLKTGYRGSKPSITLSLPTLGTVGDAGGTYTETTKGTESKNESSIVGHPEMSNHKRIRSSEIENAIDSLFEKHQEHEENRDTYDIATELFLYGYLDFIPEESEVDEALKVLDLREKNLAADN